jgi:hypothetical protein
LGLLCVTCPGRITRGQISGRVLLFLCGVMPEMLSSYRPKESNRDDGLSDPAEILGSMKNCPWKWNAC